MAIFEPVIKKDPPMKRIFEPIFEPIIETDMILGRDHRDSVVGRGWGGSLDRFKRGRPDWLEH